MRKAARKGHEATVAAIRVAVADIRGWDWNKQDAPMVRLKAHDEIYDAPVGAFFWGQTIAKDAEGKEHPYRTLWHKLPDGSVGCIPIEPLPECARAAWTHGKPPKCHTWTWDGNEDTPTLKPSVKYERHWHGHFTAGVMKNCER